jgi:osmotically-inducible protein OsmY
MLNKRTPSEAVLLNAKARWRSTVMLLAMVFPAATPSLRAQVPSNKKPAAAEEKTAASLPREIHHQLLVLPFYSVFDQISFTLHGSTVTLMGQVLRHTLKNNAEAAVRSIEGVGAVVNHIEVLPASAGDDELRNALYRSIYEDSTLARYAVQTLPAIHIIVKNATVTLVGNVESAGDKTLAASRAGVVANVQSLTNNLVVQARESAAE